MGPDDRQTEALQRLVSEGVADLASATAVDIHEDTADYRRQVATAIDEIVSGRYHKVILSRRVDLPFVLDFPSTYRSAGGTTPRRGHSCCGWAVFGRWVTAPSLSPPLAAMWWWSRNRWLVPAFGRGVDRDRAAGEPLRVLPAAAAIAESVWLSGTDTTPVTGLEWARRELAVWLHRLDPSVRADGLAAPCQLLLDGKFESAADEFQRLSMPYDAALARIDSGDADLARRGLDVLDRLGAGRRGREDSP